MGKSVTALRIENFAPAVAGRKLKLKEALKVYGKALELDHRESLEFWGELRRLSVMPNRQTLLWRISTKPTTAPKLVAAIKRYMPAEAFYDWAGGLIWLEVPATADAGTAEIRRAAAIHGGHATLIRAEASVRASVEVFQPLEPGGRALDARRSKRRSIPPAFSIPAACTPTCKGNRCRPTSGRSSSPTRASRRPTPSCAAASTAACAPPSAPPTCCLGDERDSPRGRIYLIKDMLEGGGKVSERGARPTSTAACRACRA